MRVMFSCSETLGRWGICILEKRWQKSVIDVHKIKRRMMILFIYLFFYNRRDGANSITRGIFKTSIMTCVQTVLNIIVWILNNRIYWILLFWIQPLVCWSLFPEMEKQYHSVFAWAYSLFISTGSWPLSETVLSWMGLWSDLMWLFLL